MTVVIDATDTAEDTWTCDHWQVYGIWTTKAYALDSHPRTRRRCGTINPLYASGCRRCGHPRP